MRAATDRCALGITVAISFDTLSAIQDVIVPCSSSRWVGPRAGRVGSGRVNVLLHRTPRQVTYKSRFDRKEFLVRVSILDDYGDTLRSLRCFDLLSGHEVTVWNDHVDDVDVLAQRLEHCEALVLIRERTEIRAALLSRLRHLRLISQRSVYPHIDTHACTELGIVVSSNLHAGSPSYATAELTWALILSAVRDLPGQVAALRAGHWQTRVGQSLVFKTLGIYGYGRIGKIIAGYGAAFGMRVVVHGSEASLARATADGIAVEADRTAFFATSDVVTVHLRLVDATRHVVTIDDLARMKPTALFVNTSRAGLVAPGALVTALHAGRPGLAAVDVYEHEPVTRGDEPLLDLPNVVCTPHIGYVTRDEWELQFTDVFTQINEFADGRPSNVVNPDVLTRLRTG